MVVAHERRSAQDFPLPGGFVGLFRRSVTQDFLIVANSAPARTPYLDAGKPKDRLENNGVLVGEVIVLPPDGDPAASQMLKRFLSDVHEEMDIRQHQYLSSPPGGLEGLPTELLARIDALKGQIACYRIHFALFRTGEIRLWFDLDHFLGRDTVAEPADLLEELTADVLPSQAYYFLKDVFHFHYHHHHRTDQLLDLTRLETTSCVADQDVPWRINILRGLAKVVVEYRQSNRPDSNKKALGVLAYADSFQQLLAKIRRPANLDSDFVPIDDIILYDFDHSKLSIEALDALAESDRSSSLQLFGILVGVILSALALWAGAVQIRPILCGEDKSASAAICPPIKPDLTTDFVNTVVGNPLGFVVVLTMMGFLAYIVFFRGVTKVPFAKPIYRFVKAFSSAVGAEVARRSRTDRIGYYAQLAFLGVLPLIVAWGAYKITPKNEVPAILPQRADPSGGPYASLDKLVGRLPKDSGLFSTSVVARPLRDLLGADYDLFLLKMTHQNPLQRMGSRLWVIGNENTEAQNSAFVLIDQKTQQIEVGIRKGGGVVRYRTIGEIPVKPREIQRAFGGSVADVGPFPIATSLCRFAPSAVAGGPIQLSGSLKGVESCKYQLDLRKGQSVSYNVTSARGLDVFVGDAKQDRLLTGGRLIDRDGTYRLTVSWQRSGSASDASRPIRPFYVRINVR